MIQAKALICDEKQNFSIRDVILPDPADDQIVIKTVYSGVSIGTEFALVKNKISWGPYPLCTGYMGTGIVEKVGSKISNFEKGDKVYFRGNSFINLKNGQKVSCVCGTHSSYIVVNPNTPYGAYKMPEGAPMEETSMFVLPAVGLYGVDMVKPNVGEIIIVYGCGLIGLGVIAACSHRGCVVIAVDINSKRLEKAKIFGADYLIDAKKQNVKDEVKKIVPEGADTVFECTGIPSCINQTIELCKTHGSYVWQGNYGNVPVLFNFLPAHGRRLKMFFPCDDGGQAFRKAVIKNITTGILPWGKAITNRITYKDAPAIFEKINNGDNEIMGVTIKWE
ncbi:MAG TPA: medium chain dehydrogenase/reductase family protein [Victivallales bacterium]|nr:medium chain dehydrogenase/reductase family protein [Victivallales bacterium]HPO90396.1 medium chain dehydrogenase/reductase family protein [Victivallales bacterium]HRR28066.1 medium chain dehydrogenase/reductase family protein [Victivallales bacterium]HRU01290.1 medium chain dehydrogenase/reductase family protein [Victivallales bacterium]